MRPTETIRPTFSRWLAVAVVACCLLVLGAALVTGPPLDALRALAPATGVAVLAWIMLWRPLVEVSDGGVRVVNPLRTVHVPWPALIDIDTRWTLTLRTTGGVVSAFAAPAPTAISAGTAARTRHRGDEPAGSALLGLSGEAARVIERRRRDLTEAGYLDDVRPEGAPVTVTWNVTALALLGAALVGSALLLVL